MTTQNIINTTLSGQTGTGTFVGSTSPTLITPVIGVATGTSLTFSPTTGGILGTTTNDNVSSGYVGEYVTNTAGSASISTASSTDITSISLTAGDWDVWGNIYYSLAGGTAATQLAVGISLSSGSFPSYPNGGGFISISGIIISGSNVYVLPTGGSMRLSLGSPTTVYLEGYAVFSGSTMATQGFIAARRRR